MTSAICRARVEFAAVDYNCGVWNTRDAVILSYGYISSDATLLTLKQGANTWPPELD